MDSDQPRRKRRKSPAASCGIGCMSLVLLSMLVFAVVYSSTGSYRVSVPPPLPMPAVNGLYDYISAGQQLKANGGTKRLYTRPNGVISIAAERAVVNANGSTLALLRNAFGKE